MPVQIGQQVPIPKPALAEIKPDHNFETQPDSVPFIYMELNEGIGPNFDQLPPEEQERLKAKYRYGGIRLRNDIKDKTVPIGRETMDIP
jgi:hypothetical protein